MNTSNTPISLEEFCPEVITEFDEKKLSQKLLCQLDWLGRSLTRPANIGLTKIFLIFLDSAYRGNVIMASIKFASICVITAAAIPIAIVGLGMISIARIWRSKMSVIRPENPPPPLAQLPESIKKEGLKIISLNISGLPNCINVFNGMGPIEERIEKLVDYLTASRSPPDIVCLQELFDEGGVSSLIDNPKIRDLFPYMIVDAGRASTSLSSGLGILSHFPLSKPEFRIFKNSFAEDFFANKGVLSCRLQISKNHEFVLINTHLQAREEKEAKAVRRQAIEGIRKLEELFEKEPQSGIIFAGDTNISPYSFPKDLLLKSIKSSFLSKGELTGERLFTQLLKNQEWEQKLINSFFKKDHFYLPANGIPVALRDNADDEVCEPILGSFITDTHTFTPDVSQLDHILVKRGKNVAILWAKVEVDQRAHLSDHFPLIGTLQIKGV